MDTSKKQIPGAPAGQLVQNSGSSTVQSVSGEPTVQTAKTKEVLTSNSENARSTTERSSVGTPASSRMTRAQGEIRYEKLLDSTMELMESLEAAVQSAPNTKTDVKAAIKAIGVSLREFTSLAKGLGMVRNPDAMEQRIRVLQQQQQQHHTLTLKLLSEIQTQQAQSLEQGRAGNTESLNQTLPNELEAIKLQLVEQGKKMDIGHSETMQLRDRLNVLLVDTAQQRQHQQPEKHSKQATRPAELKILQPKNQRRKRQPSPQLQPEKQQEHEQAHEHGHEQEQPQSEQQQLSELIKKSFTTWVNKTSNSMDILNYKNWLIQRPQPKSTLGENNPQMTSMINIRKRRTNPIDPKNQHMNSLPVVYQSQWLLEHQLWDMASHEWDVDSLRNFTTEFNQEYLLQKCQTQSQLIKIARTLISIDPLPFLQLYLGSQNVVGHVLDGELIYKTGTPITSVSILEPYKFCNFSVEIEFQYMDFEKKLGYMRSETGMIVDWFEEDYCEHHDEPLLFLIPTRTNGSFDLITKTWKSLNSNQQLSVYLPLSLDISNQRFSDINPDLYLNKELYELQKSEYPTDNHVIKSSLDKYFRDLTPPYLSWFSPKTWWIRMLFTLLPIMALVFVISCIIKPILFSLKLMGVLPLKELEEETRV